MRLIQDCPKTGYENTRSGLNTRKSSDRTITATIAMNILQELDFDWRPLSTTVIVITTSLAIVFFLNDVHTGTMTFVRRKSTNGLNERRSLAVAASMPGQILSYLVSAHTADPYSCSNEERVKGGTPQNHCLHCFSLRILSKIVASCDRITQEPTKACQSMSVTLAKARCWAFYFVSIKFPVLRRPTSELSIASNSGEPFMDTRH